MKHFKMAIFLFLSLFFLYSIPIYAKNTDDIWDDLSAIERQENSLTKTEKMKNKYIQIVETSDIDISDKKITALGDSITDFGGWVDEAAKISGCQITNLGIGGSAIGNYWDDTSLILRWNQIPSDSDIIIIFAGVNDYFINGEWGEKGYPDTYCGDTWSLFNNIKSFYPSADIFVVLTYRTGAEKWEQFGGREAKPYMDKQIEYANELGLNIINIYDTGYLDAMDIATKTKYVPDDVHTNKEGAQALAYNIIAKLLKYYQTAV